MKTAFVADLHSDVKQYLELRNLIHENKIESLLIGGDLLAYSRDMKEQIDFIERFLIEYFQSLSIPILLIPGNVEWLGAAAYYEALAKKRQISLLGLNPLECNRWKIIGYSYSNPSPFPRKDFERRDMKHEKFVTDKPIYTSDINGVLVEEDPAYLNRQPSIEDDLDQLNDQGIWVMHAPPFDTKLDAIHGGNHVGSKAIRKRIEQIQPTLTLHGHIHESPYVTNGWFDTIGKTICINPGRGADLHAVILDLGENGEIASAEHTIFGKQIFG
ncbi:hypothetical protein FE783_12265 [Paenibacillus mesophilus]|uniref:metallophosphoesterase family protein n=1 Tax=Paenibacillus mesophilus TaxID=2582849 RepID=UPI00110D6BCD|nr:metallophosphoesterase [Paenibacillus mesophilus]TMV50319.1 hypothetical protein FE783_12265 [Paenibacillus mesophilus]